MAMQIREIMTPEPTIMQASDTIVEAAKRMRDDDIGDVIVYANGKLYGIVTDRDLAIRGLAEGEHPAGVSLKSVCSEQVITLSPNDSTEKAVKLMREKAIRRLPVVENDKVVGIVSIGDLAVQLDRESALADISAAAANR